MLLSHAIRRSAQSLPFLLGLKQRSVFPALIPFGFLLRLQYKLQICSRLTLKPLLLLPFPSEALLLLLRNLRTPLYHLISIKSPAALILLAKTLRQSPPSLLFPIPKKIRLRQSVRPSGGRLLYSLQKHRFHLLPCL